MADYTKHLTPDQYEVCWNKDTYKCICGSSLFRSDTKFDLGTGSPSFREPVKEGSVKEGAVTSYGMVLTEVTCGKCGAQHWHVFDDGHNPTGLRYCINSMPPSLAKGATDEL
jgi:peptide-methionine (R)-S-oxide reductase